MTILASGVALVDVNFLGHPGVIASCLLHGPGGAALVDPGPASSVGGLESALSAYGLSLDDLTAVLLTHIHLDHSGATGVLVRRNPALQVYVHERGARHVTDPSRLIESAGRLYGESMERLWGEIVPVPAANVHALKGGERLLIGGREVRVEYTPGHAWHHVSYFDVPSGIAFVGDTAGARIGRADYVMPTTPPPDIDLDAWARSMDTILAWRPSALFLTHFGASDDPRAHLDQLARRLDENTRAVEASLETAGTDEERIARFAEAIGRDLRRHMSEEEGVRYELSVPPDHCWAGLARYVRKRQEAQAPRQ